jgi:hypothetical protein
MYVKKIKRKCGVRGCKNTESYAISKTREMGNSIIACKECLMDALATIEEQYKSIEEFKEATPIDEAPAVVEEPIEAVEEPIEEEKAETPKPKQTRQRKK